MCRSTITPRRVVVASTVTATAHQELHQQQQQYHPYEVQSETKRSFLPPASCIPRSKDVSSTNNDDSKIFNAAARTTPSNNEYAAIDSVPQAKSIDHSLVYEFDTIDIVQSLDYDCSSHQNNSCAAAFDDHATFARTSDRCPLTGNVKDSQDKVLHYSFCHTVDGSKAPRGFASSGQSTSSSSSSSSDWMELDSVMEDDELMSLPILLDDNELGSLLETDYSLAFPEIPFCPINTANVDMYDLDPKEHQDTPPSSQDGVSGVGSDANHDASHEGTTSDLVDLSCDDHDKSTVMSSPSFDVLAYSPELLIDAIVIPPVPTSPIPVARRLSLRSAKAPGKPTCPSPFPTKCGVFTEPSPVSPKNVVFNKKYRAFQHHLLSSSATASGQRKVSLSTASSPKRIVSNRVTQLMSVATRHKEFLKFTKTMLQLMKQDERTDLVTMASCVIRECIKRNQQGDPYYTPLKEAVIVRLHSAGSNCECEHYWNRTCSLLGYDCYDNVQLYPV